MTNRQHVVSQMVGDDFSMRDFVCRQAGECRRCPAYKRCSDIESFREWLDEEKIRVFADDEEGQDIIARLAGIRHRMVEGVPGLPSGERAEAMRDLTALSEAIKRIAEKEEKAC